MNDDQRSVLIDELFAQVQAANPKATPSVLFALVRRRLWTEYGLNVSGTEVTRALLSQAGFAE